MKKVLITSVVLSVIFGLCAYASEYTKFSRKFIKNFKDCDSYEETVTSNYQGQTFTEKRVIKGWINGFCKYQSTFSSPTNKYQIDCNFTEMEVDNLYEAMKNRSKQAERYSLDLFTEEKDPKTGQSKFTKSGTTIIKGNKAYIEWAKYQNNPYFCRASQIQ